MMIKNILKLIIPIPLRKAIFGAPKYFFYLFQINKNKIVFINFNGKGYGDNPKYICSEILRQKLAVDCVWMLEDMNAILPPKVRKISIHGLRCFYELATAHVIIINTNNVLPGKMKKKKGQIIIQTWHGSHAFKYIERQIDDMLSKSYIHDSKLSTKMTDVFISDGPNNTKLYRDAFQCTCDIIETGMPREDVLFEDDTSHLDTIRESLGIPKNKSILLYAPTFRNDGSTKAYDLDFSSILDALKQRFNSDWIMLLRLHPNVKNYNVHSDAKIIDVSSYGDVQELIAISNAVITDYSSIYHDFFISNKPVFLYTKDLDNYIKENRKLTPLFFQIPWNKNRNEEDLINDILNFDKNKYHEMITHYKNFTGAIADGKASSRVVEYIMQYFKKE